MISVSYKVHQIGVTYINQLIDGGILANEMACSKVGCMLSNALK